MRTHLFRAMPDLRYEPVPMRLRAYVDGSAVLDTRRGALVWEPRRVVPTYAVPAVDLVAAVAPTDPQPGAVDLAGLPPVLGPGSGPHTTPGTTVDLDVAGRRLSGAGFLPDDPDLSGLVVLDFEAFDRWLGEDEVLIGHPRDPYTRIDVLATHRSVEVSLAGTVLASTDRALMLLETHLPVRYYIPRSDVAMALLAPSDTHTVCSYKGRAAYVSTRDGRPEGRDIGWTYPEPLDDALRIRDHIAFWDERTDVRVAGELLVRPPRR